jgi:ribosome biogenesis GTPase / thiamine phosphate phosphatase
MNLEDIGWCEWFQSCFTAVARPEDVAGRITAVRGGEMEACTSRGPLRAHASGRLRHDASSRNELPAVGDWVALAPRWEEGTGTIHAIVPRRSSFGRMDVGGRTERQVVAANIDTVFLVGGLDADYNPRRMERYLAAAWDSGAVPVIVLNKADMAANVDMRIEEMSMLSPGVAVHAVSAHTGAGIDELRRYAVAGQTVSLLGSSGVGKSSIINRLLGEERLETNAVRESDGRGRHTTTSRELLVLPGGGAVIDTPGMRELEAWHSEETVAGAFEDVESLACACRYADCSHNGEPGCAVQEAIESGVLSVKRYRNYLHLKAEQGRQDRRRRERERRGERARYRRVAQRIEHWERTICE